ncbi:MAG: hypothetical protein LC798_08830, partial [Chloroflexi bacterium]|nr:hypothetical protein [Chloroflexota bacterium]
LSDGSVGHRVLISRLGRPGDFAWAIDRAVDDGKQTVERDRWADAAHRWFRPVADPGHLDVVWLHEADDSVRREFAYIFEGVPTMGEAANTERRRYAEEVRWAEAQARTEEQERLDLARLRTALQNDADEAWLEVADSLDTEPSPGTGIDVAKLEGWQALSDEERGLAADAAARWLRVAVPPSPNPDRSWPLETVHALRALRLTIDREGLAATSGWSDDQWTAWTNVLVGIGAVVGDTEHDASTRDSLIELAHQKAPESVNSAMRAELDREAAQARVSLYAETVKPESTVGAPSNDKPRFRYPTPLLTHTRLGHVWDGELSRGLLEWQVSQPDEVGMAETLAFQIDAGSSEALDYAKAAAVDESADDATFRRSVAGAVAMLTSKRGLECWPDVWRRWEADEAFGRALVARLASGGSWDLPAALAKLQPQALAQLYVWMQPRRASPADLVHDPFDSLCDAVLRSLQDTGTSDAVDALKLAASALPDDQALPYALKEAERRHREASWSPPHVAQLCALIVDPEKRLAASDSDLATAVIASIGRAQARLNRTTPALSDVWDFPHNPDLRRPKIEPDLSDWLKRQFEDDLPRAMVNREVEITPGFKAVRPMRELDVLVQALAPGDVPRRLEVIVENKGCWNPKVDTDIDDQLVGTYLAQTQGRAGIYVVFCFDCIASGSKGSKKCPSCSRRTVQELRDYLNDRAAVLTVPNRDVRAVVIEAGLPADYPVETDDPD